MTTRKPKPATFALGDVVTLKGQPHPHTVCPPPTGQGDFAGWIWTARSTEHSTAFHLLPIVSLTKATL